jgi:hypothetical protein
VIDGKVADAKVFIAYETGHWQVDLPVADLGKHQHSLEIYWPKHNTASNTQYYQTTSTRVKHSARVVDPQVNNIGPTCRYVKPQDPSVGCQKDIAEVLARAAGTVLKIDIEMCTYPLYGLRRMVLIMYLLTCFLILRKTKGSVNYL